MGRIIQAPQAPSRIQNQASNLLVNQMIQIVRAIVIVASFIGCVTLSGCGGNVVQAVKGVQNLQPEDEKRNQEFEELAKPASVKRNRKPPAAQPTSTRSNHRPLLQPSTKHLMRWGWGDFAVGGREGYKTID